MYGKRLISDIYILSAEKSCYEYTYSKVNGPKGW